MEIVIKHVIAALYLYWLLIILHSIGPYLLIHSMDFNKLRQTVKFALKKKKKEFRRYK